MNKVILTGYIASDPELKTTPQGVHVTTLSVAVKRPRSSDTTDFFTVICWRNTAEFVTKYFRKGSGIEVSGYLTKRKWQDKNGNNRTADEIIAEEVDFGKKSKGDDNSRSSDTSYPAQQTEEYIPADDDLPF